MAQGMTFYPRKVNSNIVDDEDTRTWKETRASMKEGVISIAHLLDEAAAYVSALKNYIGAAKSRLYPLKAILGIAECDISTAEECIAESELRLQTMRTELQSVLKETFFENQTPAPVDTNDGNGQVMRSTADTLDTCPMPDHVLRTFEKYARDTGINTGKYKPKYEEIDGLSFIILHPRSTESRGEVRQINHTSNSMQNHESMSNDLEFLTDKGDNTKRDYQRKYSDDLRYINMGCRLNDNRPRNEISGNQNSNMQKDISVRQKVSSICSSKGMTKGEIGYRNNTHFNPAAPFTNQRQPIFQRTSLDNLGNIKISTNKTLRNHVQHKSPNISKPKDICNEGTFVQETLSTAYNDASLNDHSQARTQLHEAKCSSNPAKVREISLINEKEEKLGSNKQLYLIKSPQCEEILVKLHSSDSNRNDGVSPLEEKGATKEINMKHEFKRTKYCKAGSRFSAIDYYDTNDACSSQNITNVSELNTKRTTKSDKNIVRSSKDNSVKEYLSLPSFTTGCGPLNQTSDPAFYSDNTLQDMSLSNSEIFSIGPESLSVTEVKNVVSSEKNIYPFHDFWNCSPVAERNENSYELPSHTRRSDLTLQTAVKKDLHDKDHLCPSNETEKDLIDFNFPDFPKREIIFSNSSSKHLHTPNERPHSCSYCKEKFTSTNAFSSRTSFNQNARPFSSYRTASRRPCAREKEITLPKSLECKDLTKNQTSNNRNVTLDALRNKTLDEEIENALLQVRYGIRSRKVRTRSSDISNHEASTSQDDYNAGRNTHTSENSNYDHASVSTALNLSFDTEYDSSSNLQTTDISFDSRNEDFGDLPFNPYSDWIEDPAPFRIFLIDAFSDSSKVVNYSCSSLREIDSLDSFHAPQDISSEDTMQSSENPQNFNSSQSNTIVRLARISEEFKEEFLCPDIPKKRTFSTSSKRSSTPKSNSIDSPETKSSY